VEFLYCTVQYKKTRVRKVEWDREDGTFYLTIRGATLFGDGHPQVGSTALVYSISACDPNVHDSLVVYLNLNDDALFTVAV